MDTTSSEEVHRENLTLAKRMGRGERTLRSREGHSYQKDDGSGIHDNDVQNMSADEAGGQRKGVTEVLILNSIEVLILSPSNKSKRGAKKLLAICMCNQSTEIQKSDEVPSFMCIASIFFCDESIK